MTNETKEILNRMGYDIADIHHAVFVNSFPDNWIYLVHKKGELKKNWLQKFLFGDKYYTKSIYYNKWNNREESFGEIVEKYGDSDKTYYNEDDSEYPIYFHNAIHIYTKDKYGNAKMYQLIGILVG